MARRKGRRVNRLRHRAKLHLEAVMVRCNIMSSSEASVLSRPPRRLGRSDNAGTGLNLGEWQEILLSSCLRGHPFPYVRSKAGSANNN